MDIPSLTQEAFAQHARGDLPATLATCQQILALDPSSIVALELCGITQAQLGQRDAAQATLAQALRLAPTNLSLLNNLTKLNFDAGDWRQSLDYLHQIQRLRPADASLLALLSPVQGKLLEAAQTSLALHRQVQPDRALAPQILQTGNDFYAARYFDEALECYALAAELTPDNALAHANLGAAAQSLGEIDLALLHHDRALALAPRHLPTWLNKGIALTRRNENVQAIASYAQALAIDPQHADVHWNLSLSLLKTGDYEAGWRHYEWRWQRSAYAGVAPISHQPLWLGQTPLQGKHILLYAEQGLGDTLQFCRYVRQVAELGARVTLQVQPSLQDLLACLEGVGQVISPQTPVPAHDVRCPLMSLPLAFQTRLESIPAEARYVSVDPRRAAHWQARLGPRRRPRVGLAWRGTSAHPDDAQRSLALRTLWRYLSPHCDYISLQKDIADTDRPDLNRWPKITDTRSELHSLADTAALIDNLDLVISVDTSVAHLSAALGKPTWVLLAYCPDWRWLLERSDSPWYPSVRLYRQNHPGDWHAPLLAIRQALDALPP